MTMKRYAKNIGSCWTYCRDSEREDDKSLLKIIDAGFRTVRNSIMKPDLSGSRDDPALVIISTEPREVRWLLCMPEKPSCPEDMATPHTTRVRQYRYSDLLNSTRGAKVGAAAPAASIRTERKGNSNTCS